MPGYHMLGQPFSFAFIISDMPFNIVFHSPGLIHGTLDDIDLCRFTETFKGERQTVNACLLKINCTVNHAVILVVPGKISGEIIFFPAVNFPQRIDGIV